MSQFRREARKARRRHRQEIWHERHEEAQSSFSKAWYLYREAFSFLPSPSHLAQETEGAIEMGVVKIPALIVYAPIYYAILFVGAILLVPPLWIYTAIAG